MNKELPHEAQMLVSICACMKKIANDQIEKNTALQLEQLTRRIERIEQRMGIINPVLRMEVPEKAGLNNWLAKEIMNDYKAIIRIENIKEAGEKRKEFFTKYRGIALCCINADERRQNDTIPIKFGNAGTYGSADYWAFPNNMEGYLVFPRPGKQYEEAVHNTGGYKEVFDSEYIPGKYYKTIEVLLPATFSKITEWQLKKKGKLLLKQ